MSGSLACFEQKYQATDRELDETASIDSTDVLFDHVDKETVTVKAIYQALREEFVAKEIARKPLQELMEQQQDGCNFCLGSDRPNRPLLLEHVLPFKPYHGRENAVEAPLASTRIGLRERAGSSPSLGRRASTDKYEACCNGVGSQTWRSKERRARRSRILKI